MTSKFIKSLLALTIFAAASAHAEYMMKIPLETSNGGTLPNQSIVIKDAATETPAETDEETSNNYIKLKSNGGIGIGLVDPNSNSYSWRFSRASQIIENKSPLKFRISYYADDGYFNSLGEMAILARTDTEGGTFEWWGNINTNGEPWVEYFDMPSTAIIKERGNSHHCNLTRNSIDTSPYYYYDYSIIYTCSTLPAPATSETEGREFKIEFQ